jgi:hypothetical protein
MKKYIVAIGALVALAALIAIPFANAATVDANGVVTVTKGDVQSKMGWNNAAWEANTDTEAEVAALAKKITATVDSGDGTEPVAVPGGWLTLNGQIVANYPSDEYYSHSFTNPENWGPFSTPVSGYWTNDTQAAAKVTPVYSAGQHKLTGFTVSSDGDGYVYWTRHTTYTNPEYAGATYVYHATSRWPVSVAGGTSGVTDVKVDGKPVTVTPAI